MKQDLALFDFDGTITRRDTLLDFMMFVRGRCGAAGIFMRLTPAAVAFLLKRISNQTFKENFLALAFRGFDETLLREKGRCYLNRLQSLIRPGALDRLEWHRRQGHRIVIVSASADLWLSAWCHDQKVDLICSSLEFVEGRCTGRLKGSNCRGAEKVRRIRMELDLSAHGKTYAYGDSSGDTEMLDFADESHYRPFH